MKVIIASDHAGFSLKEEIKKQLLENNYDVLDFGTTNLESVDYPDYAFQVGQEVLKDNQNKGILVCGTGIGMCIACNKIAKIRCAKVSNVEETILSREHNDANVLALSSKMPVQTAIDCVFAFLKTDFSNEERHKRRIQKITDYEEQHKL